MNKSREYRLFFFIIPTDIPHQLVSTDGKHLSILVNPLSLLGRKLRTLIEDQDAFIAFNQSVINKIYTFYQTLLFETETTSLLNKIFACLTDMISGLPECHMDKRILQAISLCQIKGGREITVTDLAKWTLLSESRARHLFKAETGVSFKRYLKWLKTLEAIKYICADDINLTEAAHMAGFSDSAHLSRTFKEIFGLIPSSVLQ